MGAFLSFIDWLVPWAAIVMTLLSAVMAWAFLRDKGYDTAAWIIGGSLVLAAARGFFAMMERDTLYDLLSGSYMFFSIAGLTLAGFSIARFQDLAAKAAAQRRIAQCEDMAEAA